MASWTSAIAPVRLVNRVARRYQATQDRHHRLVLALAAGYGAVLTLLLIYYRNWPTPDQIGLALFAFAVLTARPLAFLRDWTPFLILILSYEALRGFADGLVASTAVQFPIDADRTMFFGTLPTTWLQERLWDPDNIRWYDYASALLHPMHFVVPLVVAFLFWIRDRRRYWLFVLSYLLLTYAGYVTYVLYPMAPPWYAAAIDRIPNVDIILHDVLWRHSASHPIVIVYDRFNANPVAAMPSLHAAFPALVASIAVYLQPRIGWLTIAYPLGMNFAVVYMGEHYVIDVLVGNVYGVAAFVAVWVLPGWVRARAARRRESAGVARVPALVAQED